MPLALAGLLLPLKNVLRGLRKLLFPLYQLLSGQLSRKKGDRIRNNVTIRVGSRTNYSPLVRQQPQPPSSPLTGPHMIKFPGKKNILERRNIPLQNETQRRLVCHHDVKTESGGLVTRVVTDRRRRTQKSTTDDINRLRPTNLVPS